LIRIKNFVLIMLFIVKINEKKKYYLKCFYYQVHHNDFDDSNGLILDKYNLDHIVWFDVMSHHQLASTDQDDLLSKIKDHITKKKNENFSYPCWSRSFKSIFNIMSTNCRWGCTTTTSTPPSILYFIMLKESKILFFLK
jgi:hypothetical protein